MVAMMGSWPPALMTCHQMAKITLTTARDSQMARAVVARQVLAVSPNTMASPRPVTATPRNIML